MISAISRRSVLSLTAVAAALPVLSACTPGSSSVSTPTAPSPSGLIPTTLPDGMGSGQEDGVFPRTVTHFQGATEIKAEPQRIVAIATGQLDGLLTLGLVPVGVASGKGADLVPAYVNAAFPGQASGLAAIQDVGSRTEPSVEAIANLGADLILMNIAGKDAEALYTSLSAVAPTVATEGTGTNWKQDFLLIADAVGKRDAARSWLDTFAADAMAAGKKIDDATTVSLLRKNGDRTRIFGAVSFAGSVLADMGVARPATQGFTDDTSVDISEEQLAQADADWILYGVQGGDETELTSMTLWPTLGAVSTDHVVEVDDDPFYLNAGPTAARVVLDTVASTLS